MEHSTLQDGPQFKAACPQSMKRITSDSFPVFYKTLWAPLTRDTAGANTTGALNSSSHGWHTGCAVAFRLPHLLCWHCHFSL